MTPITPVTPATPPTAPLPAIEPAPVRLSLASRLAGWQASRGVPHALLWVALVSLLLVAQTLLVVLTLRHEEARAQERSDDVAAAALGDIRRRTQMALQGLQVLQQRPGASLAWARSANELLRNQREIGRIERRDLGVRILEAAESPFREPLFLRWPRADMDVETEVACDAARRVMAPMFSRSQFVPLAGGRGVEVMDVCVPVQQAGQLVGFTVASFVLPLLLEEVRVAEVGRSHELSFVEADGTRLARSGAVRGGGVFIADRVVDLPGTTLQVRVDAVQRAPRLIPNLATALVLGLSIGLFVVVVLLLRDGRRRARAEGLLAEALAFRKAMEDSLLTGLRARDRGGRIVYANPAFCTMVGYSSEELQRTASPPYWPPEQAAEYQRRQAERLAPGAALEPLHEGYETVFLRRSGERFPVMIYETPLVDGVGKHTGWMSSVLDLSAQRRAEDLSRQQQERLQATARLATVGEMASLLSHELNQPLSAIASYATGSLNLLAEPDGQTLAQMQQALTRIAEQAERAGRVIKSVHNFVRRRHSAHEVIAADLLIESVLPLVRLQARKSGVRIAIDGVQPSPRVKVDRTMVEQVLLNLARNAVQAMEVDTPLPDRVLTLRFRLVAGAQGNWVVFSVIDTGSGIAAEVAPRLFTPFFTTKDEGMGLGLSLCRTVIEQHGGTMDFDNLPPRPGQALRQAGADGSSSLVGGVEFRFVLPLSLPRGPSV
jgi:two-component system sensor histidine kinase DctS